MFSFAVFDPGGPVASAERVLITTNVLIMLTIVIPTLIVFFVIARKYRAGNKKAKYEPNRRHNPWSELILWALPAVIIAILAVITWGATHALDPYRPLSSSEGTPRAKPLMIQVVALDWKWLFIYPEQRIATVNFVQFPAGTPLNFQLTADNAPMNSFWIPQLGGQIYAMAGMTTQTHLMADAPGEFTGRAAEINGAGYANMTFTAKAVTQADFDAWVGSVQQSAPALTIDEYNKLTEPSENVAPMSYSGVAGDLYHMIVMKPMTPTLATSTASNSAPAVMQMQ